MKQGASQRQSRALRNEMYDIRARTGDVANQPGQAAPVRWGRHLKPQAGRGVFHRIGCEYRKPHARSGHKPPINAAPGARMLSDSANGLGIAPINKIFSETGKSIIADSNYRSPREQNSHVTKQQHEISGHAQKRQPTRLRDDLPGA